MLRHVVLWTFKEHAEGADKAANLRRAKSLLESCAGLTPGLLHLEVRLAEPGLECHADLVLYCEFEDVHALELYQQHPHHLAVKPFIGAVRLTRQCMDFIA